MAEQRTAPEHHYDPLWDEGRTRRQGGRWAKLAIGLSIAAHAGLVYYIYETKFVTHYKNYSDDTAIKAELMPKFAPPPKPPEAPKPPLKQEPPSKPAITPHIASAPLDSIAPPSVLQFSPSEQPPLPPAEPLPLEPAKPAPAPVIANPNWSSRPSGEDMARYYPERAQRLETPGNVTLQCQVTAKGTVSACSVLSEDPTGFGFGDAALKLSRLFKMKPKMEDGQAVEGATVKIPIAFRIAS